MTRTGPIRRPARRRPDPAAADRRGPAPLSPTDAMCTLVGSMTEVEQRATTRTARRHRDWRPSMHTGFGTFVVVAPIAVVVAGVVLDRAGYSMVGITMTMLGAVAFLVMLFIVGLWG